MFRLLQFSAVFSCSLFSEFFLSFLSCCFFLQRLNQTVTIANTTNLPLAQPSGRNIIKNCKPSAFLAGLHHWNFVWTWKNSRLVNFLAGCNNAHVSQATSKTQKTTCASCINRYTTSHHGNTITNSVYHTGASCCPDTTLVSIITTSTYKEAIFPPWYQWFWYSITRETLWSPVSTGGFWNSALLLPYGNVIQSFLSLSWCQHFVYTYVYSHSTLI